MKTLTETTKMLKLSLLLFLAQFGPEAAGLDIPILSDLQDIMGLAHDIGDIASGNIPLTSFFTGHKDPVHAKLDGLSQQIEELAAAFNVKIDNALSQILTNVPRETDFRARMNSIGGYMARISFLFNMYQQISKSSGNYNDYTVDQFIEAATSLHEGDVIETLNQMHRMFTGRQDDDTSESVMQLAAVVYQNMETAGLCGHSKSRQQRAYDLYRTVVITEVKGFIMTAYAYGVLATVQNSSFTSEIRKAEERLITRVSDYLYATKIGLAPIPRDIYVCDPEVHRFDKTFVDMTRAVQLTVVHESMMREIETCQGQCQYVDTSTIYRSYKGWYPKMTCEGRMTNCRDLYNTEICEIDDDESIDRLVYINSDTLGKFGVKDRCALGHKTFLDSYLSTFHYCEPCLCECVEEKKNSTATRAFNLRPQVSDIDNNMVLTGISFAKEDNVIHLQIEQGKLTVEGKIEEGSAKWVRLDEFVYKPELSWQGGFELWKNWESHPMEEGKDYVFIHYDRRKVQLDDLIALGKNYVVTGVKLKVSEADKNAIALAIRLTRFNFTTGELIAKSEDIRFGEKDKLNTKIHSIWLDQDFLDQRAIRSPRIQIDVTNKQDPFRSYGNVPASEPNSEVKLTYSNEREDVGQSTIPYFDMQRSGPMPRVALDGIGMYLRRNDVSGGFVSFKTFTHDLSKYLNPKIDPSSLRSGEMEEIAAAENKEELV